MVNVLYIETSGMKCSVALGSGQQLLANLEVEEERYVHSEQLHLLINKVFEEAGFEKGNLDAVMVCEGPGSYTGLRIGVASAKGICYALKIPLMVVSSLELLFLSVEELDEKALYCPMIDARRMEVYTCLYSGTGELLEPISPIIVDHSFLADYSEKKIYYFGDGAEKCQSLFSDQYVLLKEPTLSAQEMLKIGQKKFAKSDFVDLAYFEPNYLKEFQVGKAKKLF